MLTAGAAGAVGVDTRKSARIDINLDIVINFRGDTKIRCKGGVTAITRIERRLANQAVHASFGAQPAVTHIHLQCLIVALLMTGHITRLTPR